MNSDGSRYEVSVQVEPTLPYEQGFRDGLLTAQATLAAIETQGESFKDSESNLGAVLDRFVDRLDALIDQKNHDLWNLLAIARADLSRHPEAEVLRTMLRAPSGLLVNSSGQVLFIRIKETEYDTGVLALLEEVERLKAAENKGSSAPTEAETMTSRDPDSVQPNESPTP